MFECVSSAPAGSQHAHDKPVRVLAQTADLNCPAGSPERLLVTARMKLLLREPNHGIERQALQPLPLDAQPFGPGLFRDSDVGQQTVPVEADRRMQGIAGTLSEQRLELRHVAHECARPQRHCLPIGDQGAFAQDPAKPREGLAQVLPCLSLKMRAPKQGHELVAAVRLRGRAGQEGQQAGQLLAGQIDEPLRPAQFEAAEERKLKGGRRRAVHTCPANAL